MHHLLAGDVEEHSAPPLDDLELVRAETRTGSAPETERGVQVLAHHGVLELRTLGEQVVQLFPALHEDGRLSRHARKVSPDAPPGRGRRARPSDVRAGQRWEPSAGMRINVVRSLVVRATTSRVDAADR